ncbi:MAG: azurin [Saprospiraceae bacterium]|nr:azurin [Saprospiraceae bacterium]
MFFASCGNNASTSDSSATESTDTEMTEEAPAAAEDEAIVTIKGDDAMKYDITEIKVKEGQTVSLTLVHTGKAPVAAMGHNWVLLKQGVDMEKFATAAINAKDNDYIPKDMEGDVIAHTKTIGGGETTDIEFTAPAKGTYDFLCSFPGHHATMKGKFIVE